MKRRLSCFDEAAARTDRFAPFNVVAVLRLAHGPSPRATRQALARLQARHPLLKVRLSGRPGRQSFETTPESPFLVTEVEKQGDDHWLDVTEKELNLPFETGRGPLARCVLLLDPAEPQVREMVITLHHTIVDGVSGANLIHELLVLCQALAEGGSASWCTPLELQPPLEELFPAPFRGPRLMPRMFSFMARQAADEIRYRNLTRGGRRPPLHGSGQGRILPLSLSRTATAKMITRSRKKRVSINSLLSAAMLMAVHRRLYQGRPTALRNFVFTDLRPYLKPASAKKNLGCHIGMSRFTNPMGPATEVWGLSRAVQAQVHESSQRGEVFLNALTAKRLMALLIGLKSFRMGNTALSYNGLPRLDPAYGRTKVVDIRIFISNNILGPEFTGQAAIWNGRLNLDLLYLDSDMDQDGAKAISQEMLRLLEDR